jgi:hypothetical protein
LRGLASSSQQWAETHGLRSLFLPTDFSHLQLLLPCTHNADLPLFPIIFS